MKLFVGLGNYGAKYDGNRHNIGFMVIDEIMAQFGDGVWQKNFHGLVGKVNIDGQKYLLLKPQTYMNLSGQSVQSCMAFYQWQSQDICVFHDEIDIDFGKMKMKIGGGSGGHNGIKDIDARIGKEYWRVRIGVGHPGHKDLVADFVLSNFTKDEQSQLPQIIKQIMDKSPQIITKNISQVGF